MRMKSTSNDRQGNTAAILVTFFVVNSDIAAPNSNSSSSSVSSHAGSETPEVEAELGALHNLTKEVKA